MLTNVISYLHTTLAYQSAAMQLMVGQANFDAQQLHLQETLPIVVPADTNQWKVSLPPDGVGGRLTTSNYIFRFSAGKLMSIQMRNRPHGAVQSQPSLMDTNSAYQLARQWLTALSVDVPALERDYPPSIRFAAAPSTVQDRPRGHTNSVDRAAKSTAPETPSTPAHTRAQLFNVEWGGHRGPQSPVKSTPMQISVEIFAATRQCLNLRIINPDLLQAPPLQVTNAAALLGPPPTPQHYVEEFLGGNTAYDTIARPDRVLIWLVGSSPNDPDTKVNRTQAYVLDAATSALFSQTFTDFNSYSWLDEKPCAPEYDVRLQFTKGTNTVDVAWCYECDRLQVTHKGRSTEKDCDTAHVPLLRAVRAIFPKDEAINNPSLLNSH